MSSAEYAIYLGDAILCAGAAAVLSGVLSLVPSRVLYGLLVAASGAALGLGILSSSTLGGFLLGNDKHLLTRPDDGTGLPTWAVLGTLSTLLIAAAVFAVAPAIGRRRSRSKTDSR
ncbi:hypothetical protein PH213_43955 [Streptomyces sp. SRF1]|uniref:hypothetical protein n=1 Tax=Streptomyces sp. SRF1 TaxID=1549642 RepID=UPI0025B24855|nr:hypothetical protein [Streptomyces sp. SRF1]MDN3061327.1 hypothetical protein [Streptomyces sp. SRF1]